MMLVVMLALALGCGCNGNKQVQRETIVPPVGGQNPPPPQK